MALEHFPHEQRSDIGTWRGLDFACLEILERWLTTEGLDEPHDEGEVGGDGVYVHQGYKALLCSDCHQPTIVGRAAADGTCGRRTCDAAVSEGVA